MEDIKKVEKEHKYLVPLLIVLLIVVLLGAVGFVAYNYYLSTNQATEEITPPLKDKRSEEEKTLDAVEKDLKDAEDLDMSGVEEDLKEIEQIDISGA